MSELTLVDVHLGLGNLKQVFSVPKGVAVGEQMARLYFMALRDLTREDFESAITQAIKTESKFWPRPGKLRELANDYRKDRGRSVVNAPLTPYEEWLAHPGSWHFNPCPICAAILEFPEGKRGGVWHDELKHREAEVAVVGHVREAPL